MVGEVVDDGDAAGDAADLLPALDAQEALPGPRDLGERDARGGRPRHHAEQVLEVVGAGQAGRTVPPVAPSAERCGIGSGRRQRRPRDLEVQSAASRGGA